MVWKLKKRERYALIEQDSENPRKHRGTFYIGPRHVKHHYSKEFVEFSYVTAPNFASEKDCRVFAQNSHVAMEVYDFYVKLFDPDYENVSVYDERFIVQYLFKTTPKETWKDIGAWNPTIQVIPLDDGVEIKRIFDTDYGTQSLEVSHIIRTGALLKHKILFTNKTADTKVFRAVMKLAGITSNKVRHKDGELQITKETSIGKQPFFVVGEDNKHLKLSEYLWSLGVEETGEWSPTVLRDIVFDVHAYGCKADIIIGNYTLGENQSLLIDPDSDTWQVNAGNDDAVEYGSGSFDAANDYNRVRSYTSPLSSNYVCCGARFISINISQGDTIDSANVQLYTYSGTYDDMNSVIYGNDVDNAKNFAAAPTGNPHIISTEDRPRTSASVSWVEDGIGAGVWATKSVTSIIQEIVNRGSWSSGNALVLLFIANTDVYKVFRAKSYENSTTQCPKLYIEWTSGATYTKTWQTDVLFKKLGITKTAVVDAAFKKPDITKTFAVDSAFLKTQQLQRQVDALFKKLDILKSFGIDTDFLKKNIIKSFAIDVRFGAVQTFTLSKQIDALFKKFGITRTFAVDVDFLKTQQLQRQVDALFRKTSAVQKQVNALFKKLGLLRQFGVDVDFQKTVLIQRQIDVLLQKSMITQKQVDAVFKKLGISKTFGLDAWFGTVGAVTYTKTLSIDVIFRYKVRFPLFISQNGQIIIPTKRDVWVGD